MESWLLLALGIRVVAGVWCSVLLVRARHPGMLVVFSAVVLANIRLLQQWEDMKPAEVPYVLFGSLLAVGGVYAAHATLIAHRNQARDQKVRADIRYRRILETALEGIWTIDRDGRTVFANDRLAEMLGYTPDQIIGTHATHFFAISHAEQARERLSRPINTPSVEVSCLRHKSGAECWVRLSNNPLWGDDGHYEGALAMVTDITAERRAKASLARRTYLLQELVRHRPLPQFLGGLCVAMEDAVPGSFACVCLLEEGGTRLKLRAGPSLTPTLRQALTDMALTAASASALTRSANSAQPAKLLGLAELGIDLGIQPTLACHAAAIISSADSHVLGVLFSFFPLSEEPDEEQLAEQGDFAGLAAVAIEYRSSRDDVDQARSELVSALEQSPAAIAIADASTGRVQMANHRALDLTAGAPINLSEILPEDLPLGWRPHYSDGRPFHREDLPLVAALERGVTTANAEVLQRRDLDGQKRWVLMSAAPLRDSAGRITGAIAVSLDISHRKQDERDKERLLTRLGTKTEELDQLFRATTHDLRAPLVNVEGFTGELDYGLEELEQILLHAELDGHTRASVTRLVREDLRSFLKLISSSAQRMDQLMKGMARLNAIDSHAQAPTVLKLGDLVQEALSGSQYRLRAEGFAVEVGELPACVADRVQLGQVLTNLIDNAIKYRDDKRPAKLTISGGTSGRYVWVSVADAGIGIGETELERIFLPFHRVTKSGPSGQGLGLAILRRMLNRMDGDVTVESELGVGSTFRIRLPAPNPAMAEVELPQEPVGEPST